MISLFIFIICHSLNKISQEKVTYVFIYLFFKIQAWAGVEETASLIEEKKNLDWTAVEKEVYLSLALLIAQLAALTHKGSELALITPGSDPHAIANSFRE